MVATLKHAIIGAGVMGTNHARVTANIRDVDVALVVDPDELRAKSVAGPTDASWARALPRDLTGIDTAVVSVPTERHRACGLKLMEAGVHVLMEKPLAANATDAEMLVDAAKANDVVLLVGHIEQFNTAIIEAHRWIDEVVHVSATRVGPYSDRVNEGVVFDLMIHDLDIVRHFVGSPLVEVQSTLRRTRSDAEDLACALLRFESGVTASLTASRVGQDKVRRVEITQSNSTISIDLLQQGLRIHRMAEAEYIEGPVARYRQSGVVEIPFLQQMGEPLLNEVRHFFHCVRQGTTPRVSGQDGLETVRWAERVVEAAHAVW